MRLAAMEGRELELATLQKVSRRLIPYLFVLKTTAGTSAAVLMLRSCVSLRPSEQSERSTRLRTGGARPREMATTSARSRC